MPSGTPASAPEIGRSTPGERTVASVGGRASAMFLARGIDERSEPFAWIRAAAIATLAALVTTVVSQPSAVLPADTLLARWLAVGSGVAAVFAIRRSLLGGLLAGEALLVAAARLSG